MLGHRGASVSREEEIMLNTQGELHSLSLNISHTVATENFAVASFKIRQ